jgi:hypothetical protein
MDGLSCSIWRLAELFQQVAVVSLKPTAHSSINDVKLIVVIPCEAKEGLRSGSICFAVVNVEQMQVPVEIMVLTFTVSKRRDLASVFVKLFLL